MWPGAGRLRPVLAPCRPTLANVGQIATGCGPSWASIGLQTNTCRPDVLGQGWTSCVRRSLGPRPSDYLHRTAQLRPLFAQNPTKKRHVGHGNDTDEKCSNLLPLTSGTRRVKVPNPHCDPIALAHTHTHNLGTSACPPQSSCIDLYQAFPPDLHNQRTPGHLSPGAAIRLETRRRRWRRTIRRR